MLLKHTFTYSRAADVDIQLDLYLPDDGIEPDTPPGSMGAARAALKKIGIRKTLASLARMSDSGSSSSSTVPTIPAAVFFHGGGLTAGDREFMLTEVKGMLEYDWLVLCRRGNIRKSNFKVQLDQFLSASCAFISADYRLLFPFTGNDILADVLPCSIYFPFYRIES